MSQYTVNNVDSTRGIKSEYWVASLNNYLCINNSTLFRISPNAYCVVLSCQLFWVVVTPDNIAIGCEVLGTVSWWPIFRVNLINLILPRFLQSCYALATRQSKFRFLDGSSLFWLIFGKFSSKICPKNSEEKEKQNSESLPKAEN